MNFYYCSKCNAITKRDSDNIRIKSFCQESGKDSFLLKVKSIDDLANRIRKLFLKNQFEISSYNSEEIELLKYAFEQGVKVALNLFK